jgi:hypothetical protein
MLTTEAEAAEKWCPAARITTLPDGTVLDNRGGYASWGYRSALPKCIGSRCMAWRWGTRDAHAFRDPDRARPPTLFVTTWAAEQQARAQGLEPLGRCGLGGEP